VQRLVVNYCRKEAVLNTYSGITVLQVIAKAFLMLSHLDSETVKFSRSSTWRICEFSRISLYSDSNSSDAFKLSEIKQNFRSWINLFIKNIDINYSSHFLYYTEI